MSSKEGIIIILTKNLDTEANGSMGGVLDEAKNSGSILS
jgi:hypothetical protein